MKILRISVPGRGETALVLDVIVAVERSSTYVIDREWTSVHAVTLLGPRIDVGYYPSDEADRVYEQILGALEAHESGVEIVGADSGSPR